MQWVCRRSRGLGLRCPSVTASTRSALRGRHCSFELQESRRKKRTSIDFASWLSNKNLCAQTSTGCVSGHPGCYCSACSAPPMHCAASSPAQTLSSPSVSKRLQADPTCVADCYPCTGVLHVFLSPRCMPTATAASCCSTVTHLA